MNLTGLKIALAIAVVAGLLFGFFPGLDLAVSRYFYETIDIYHRPFSYRFEPLVMSLRHVGLWISAALAAPVVLAFALKLARPRSKMLISGRLIVFFVVSLVLGPGLLVNTALKNHWGRPRPIQVEQFDGPYKFVPWWDPHGACPTNCSFVSGDVASAFWTIAPAAVTPPQWRALAYGAALTFGVGMSIIRVIMGGHFLSDTIFAGVFTFLVIWLVHGFVYRWPWTRLESDGIERALERFSDACAEWLAWFGERAAQEISGPDGDAGADENLKRRRGWW